MHLKGSLNRALDVASAKLSDASWRRRLAAWRREWSGKAEAAVGVVLNAPAELMEGASHFANIVTEGLDAIRLPTGAWEFAPALRTRGVSVRTYRGPLPSVKLVADPNQLLAQVEVFAEEHRIEVRLPRLREGQVAPLVVLVPTEPEGEPQVRSLEAVPVDRKSVGSGQRGAL